MAFKKGIKYFCYTTVLSVPAAVTVFDTVFCVSKVQGKSMQPTLNPGKQNDWVLLNIWGARHYQFKRGEIISFKSPKSPEQTYIKRLVGLEGDYVKKRGKSDITVRVPKGHCWVEGDNNKQSLDSNVFGPLPLGMILAKASYVIWPPQRVQQLEIVPPVNRHIVTENS